MTDVRVESEDGNGILSRASVEERYAGKQRTGWIRQKRVRCTQFNFFLVFNFCFGKPIAAWFLARMDAALWFRAEGNFHFQSGKGDWKSYKIISNIGMALHLISSVLSMAMNAMIPILYTFSRCYKIGCSKVIILLEMETMGQNLSLARPYKEVSLCIKLYFNTIDQWPACGGRRSISIRGSHKSVVWH